MTFLQKPTHVLILLIVLATMIIAPVVATEHFTPDFANSPHVLKHAEKIGGYYYYLNEPSNATILDYILEQAPNTLEFPNSRIDIATEIYLTEIYLVQQPVASKVYTYEIAYTRPLTQAEIDDNLQPTALTSTEIEEQLDTLPNELLIAKNTKNGVFINIGKIRNDYEKIFPYIKLLDKIKFKWIAIYNYGDGIWYNTIYGTRIQINSSALFYMI